MEALGMMMETDAEQACGLVLRAETVTLLPLVPHARQDRIPRRQVEIE
jgi:hypothetical protein